MGLWAPGLSSRVPVAAETAGPALTQTVHVLACACRAQPCVLLLVFRVFCQYVLRLGGQLWIGRTC